MANSFHPERAATGVLVAGLSEALGSLPGLVVVRGLEKQPRLGGAHVDATLRLAVAGRPLMLVIETKRSTAHPRDIPLIVSRLKDACASASSRIRAHAVPLLAANTVSPGARQLLRDSQVGYYDLGGSLFIPAEGAYVFVDKPAPSDEFRKPLEVFQRKSARVVHVLLTSSRDWFNAKEIATQVRVTVSTASRTLIELERLDLVRSRGAGRHKERTVPDRGALLDAWERTWLASRAPAMRSYFVPGASRGESLLQKVSHAFPNQVDFGITHEAAGQLYAPFLTSYATVRVRAVATSLLAAAIGSLNARPVEEGANLAVIELDDVNDLFLGERIDGLPVASPIQVYLDLLRGPGRAAELAKHLRKEKIGF